MLVGRLLGWVGFSWVDWRLSPCFSPTTSAQLSTPIEQRDRQAACVRARLVYDERGYLSHFNGIKNVPATPEHKIM